MHTVVWGGSKSFRSFLKKLDGAESLIEIKSLDEALEMIPAVLDDSVARERVSEMREKVAGGKSFADAVVESGLFDEFYSGLIRTSAAVGNVDGMMEKVAAEYENRVEEGIAGLVSIIEPTLVAVLSVVIGAVLLSVMLPMAGIISSIL